MTIEHADASIATTHLNLGDEIASMSDADILDAYNAVIGAQEQLRREWDNTVVEIPPAEPQIKLNCGSGQWVPQGQVLRCIIEDNSEGEAVICIDDMELSLREFGRLLTVYAGWGNAHHIRARRPDRGAAQSWDPRPSQASLGRWGKCSDGEFADIYRSLKVVTKSMRQQGRCTTNCGH